MRQFTHEPGLVNAVAYCDGRKAADISVDEAGEWARRPGHFVWIGLYEPKLDLLARVQKQFDLHPLAIEDAEQAHQHPLIEEYGNTLFIVAQTAQMVDGRIEFGETHLFIGRGYVVSVRHGASRSYSERASLRNAAARPSSCRPRGSHPHQPSAARKYLAGAFRRESARRRRASGFPN